MADLGFPRRGEIYWVQPTSPERDGEAPLRPAVIVSANVANEVCERVTVAPIVFGATEQTHPFEVRVGAGEAGLFNAAMILADQIRSVAKAQLTRRIGTLPEERLGALDEALRLTLGL